MRNKIIAVLLIAATLGGNTIAIAAPNVTVEQQQAIQQYSSSYNNLSAEITNLESRVTLLDNEISNLTIEINKTNEKIVLVEKECEQKEIEYQNSLKTFGARARSLYMHGNIESKLSLLLGSENFSDFINRFTALTKIMKLDKDILNKVETIKKDLDSKKVELEKLREENIFKMNSLDSKKKEMNSKLEELKSKQAQTKANLMEVERDIIKIPISIIKSSNSPEELENTINTLRQLRKIVVTPAVDAEIVSAIEEGKVKKNQKLTISRGSYPVGTLPSSSNSLVLFSYQFLGTPYVWGGTTPSGFDCSGFTSYIYANHGVNIGRTTYDQIKVGKSIPISQLQPGDLIFFGSVSSPHHVGMYIGGGRYIHAPHTGDVVKISGLGGDICATRRIL